MHACDAVFFLGRLRQFLVMRVDYQLLLGLLLHLAPVARGGGNLLVLARSMEPGGLPLAEAGDRLLQNLL